MVREVDGKGLCDRGMIRELAWPKVERAGSE